MQEAIVITEIYNRVRFGGEYLTDAENERILRELRKLEGKHE
jgi:hypothetical protein